MEKQKPITDKDKVIALVKSNAAPTVEEVLAIIANFVQDKNGKRNFVRDTEIFIKYIRRVGTMEIAKEHNITGERVRQIVRKNLRCITSYTVKLEHNGQHKSFYEKYPRVTNDSGYLDWVLEYPNEVLSRVKYLIVKYAG